MTFTGMSKKFILGLAAALLVSTSAFAASEGYPWDKAPNRTQDMAALQNGAKLFVNYCLNCHSAAFMRYSRLTDLGLAAALLVSTSAFAASEGYPWDKAPNRTQDMAALQNGAKLFVNYCLNCH